MTKKIKILLVEDEVVNAMILEKQLKIIGYEVAQHVTTGDDAVSAARQDRPDVVLMDIRLIGEMDGIEAATIINSNIPVIFITGYDDETTREKTVKLKPLAYLVKPLAIGDLKQVLDEYFA